MALIVQKYGGTSVGTTERIRNVAAKVKKERERGNDVVVVVSAMSGETNRLISLAAEIDENPAPREMDVLVSTGEQVTIALLSMALQALGCDARSYTGGQIRILTDNAHSKARILDINDSAVRELGRGGSDTTAVAMAAALKADECQIFTDVDGVYTTDPRVEPRARRLDKITFEEMLEMASLGSKVLQIRAVEFAGKYSVPLRVLSSFEEGEGTLITFEDEGMEEAKISGIAFNRDESQLTVRGVPDQPGIAYKILGPIADANVEIDMIVQNTSQDGTTDFTFTVHRNDYQKAFGVLNRVSNDLGGREVKGNDGIVKLSLVGVGMRSHAGIASQMFKALSDEGINICMISTSEIKISVVIDEKYLELGVRALHEAFDLEQA